LGGHFSKEIGGKWERGGGGEGEKDYMVIISTR